MKSTSIIDGTSYNTTSIEGDYSERSSYGRFTGKYTQILNVLRDGTFKRIETIRLVEGYDKIIIKRTFYGN